MTLTFKIQNRTASRLPFPHDNTIKMGRVMSYVQILTRCTRDVRAVFSRAECDPVTVLVCLNLT